MRTELNTCDTFSEFACLTFSYLAELLESPIVAMSGRSTEDSVALQPPPCHQLTLQ